ncbi:hypothetical protein CR513_40248, partial [Mucuna pruriens]
MASNTQQFGIRGAITNKAVIEVGMVDNLRMENQLTELTSLVSQHQQIPQVRISSICTSVEHFTDMCPTLQEIESDNAEFVGVIGGNQYSGQLATIPTKATTNTNIEQSPSMEVWMKFQQNMDATMHDLKMQIRQLANLIIDRFGKPSLTTNPNPKGGNVSAVTLRNGKELQPNPADIESEPEANSQVQQQAKINPIPFPSRTISARKAKMDEEFSNEWKSIFRSLMPSSRFLRTEVGGVLSAFIQKEVATGTKLALPRKCRDLGIFLVLCTIGDYTFTDAMLDLGASINVMPALVYKSLNFADQEPTGIVIQLANRSMVQPFGILEDVNDLIFPTDFYVLEMEDEASRKGCTLILGQPFLMTARTKIDVHARTLSMEFGDNLV